MDEFPCKDASTCTTPAACVIAFWGANRSAFNRELREGFEEHVRPVEGIDEAKIRAAAARMTPLQTLIYWLMAGMFGRRYTRDEVNEMLIEPYGINSLVLRSSALRRSSAL